MAMLLKHVNKQFSKTKLGLIQYFMLSYLQVRFTIKFNCYGTLAFVTSNDYIAGHGSF